MATTSESAIAPPGFKLAFDVTDLNKTCAFYQALGGFTVASVARAGQIFETRHLTSPSYPGVHLLVRASFGKRAVGTSPGGITTISLPVAHLPTTIRRLTGKARWVGPSPEAAPDEPRTSVVLVDPDAYQIELYQA
ncbi:MAG TPA: VOC family protein [Gemmatimonadales bacterium]|jgi:catechol 2,3-dioxygenase-like lactoylglutathione lyase family enzyme|nr:VOC family protein [Gemmatimonadales bacterium]